MRPALILSILKMSLVMALLLLGPAVAQSPVVVDDAGAALDSAAAQPVPSPLEAKADSKSDVKEADPGLPALKLVWFWTVGQKGDDPSPLLRATIAALALLIAFLTVVELWQVPPPSTSLVKPGRPAAGKDTVASQAEPAAAPAPSSSPPARIGNIFESNFSRIVLSGLGGLAAVTFIGDGAGGDSKFNKEGYYFVLFVLFFVAGLVLSALIRGAGEAMRSRIVLSRPMVTWPSLRGDHGFFGKAGRLVRYLFRRFWYWLISFRATFVVFVDTVFNVLTGRNQLQTALFSETITDLHEALLEAAERAREEVHRAVIRALIRKEALPRNLPHEEQVRVAVSLLSADGGSVYYIAWEHGSPPTRFGKSSVAWVAAFARVARWCKCDLHGAPDRWDLIYRSNKAAWIFDNQDGEIPGTTNKLPLEKYYEKRGEEDYEGFVVLPIPWTNRSQGSVHRRGCLHISFKKASYMDKLWQHLEHYPGKWDPVPNYEQWRGLLEPIDGEAPGVSPVAEVALRHAVRTTSGPGLLQTQVQAATGESARVEAKPEEAGSQEGQALPPIALLDRELGAVLHQALEVLGHALSHFDDEVYDVYVRSRRPSAEIPR